MGAEIGTRMTVVRPSDGALLVHSPIRLTHDLGRVLASLGRVEHVAIVGLALTPRDRDHCFARDRPSEL